MAIKRMTIEWMDGTTQNLVPESAPVPPVPEPVTPPPVPEPITPPPVPPTPATNIGMNLEAVEYWSGERAFNNLGRMIMPLLSSKVGSWGGGAAFSTFDANGWPTSFPTGCYAVSLVDLNKGHGNVEYTFSHHNGAVTIDGQTAPGKFVKRADTTRVLIRINKPIPSFTFQETTNTSADTWYAPFLNRNRQYACLRFMDWAKTNAQKQVSLGTRVKPNYYTQAGEVAVDSMIELCNLTGRPIWYNVHHSADDTYVLELAKLFKTCQTKIYLEHSNEVWNSGFPTYKYCQAKSPKTGSPVEYHIQRTAQIARIFRNAGVPVVSVLGGQAASAGHMDWVIQSTNLPADIDAFAIAPYFGGTIPTASQLSVPAILAECDKQISGLVKGWVQEWVTLAGKYKKQLVGYEGGQHVCPVGAEVDNAAIVNAFIAANRDQGMYDLYRKYLSMWDTVTGKSLMIMYNSAQPPTKWGSWGHQEYESQAMAEAPKYRAVADHIRGA